MLVNRCEVGGNEVWPGLSAVEFSSEEGSLVMSGVSQKFF